MALTTLASSARAGEADDDEELIRRGVALRRAGKDQDALEAFRAAYHLRPTPHARGQMGLGEQALGRWVEAARDLDGALQASDDPWVVKNLPTLRAALVAVEQHVGRLQVLGSPAGARVNVDDEHVGELPMSSAVRVPTGEVVISVAAPGHISISRKVAIQSGQITRETIALHAAGAEPAATGGNQETVPPATAARPEEPTAARPQEPHGSTHRARVGAWVALAAASVALALGIGENVSYLGKKDDFDRGLPAGRCGSALAGRGAAGCSNIYDDMMSAKTGAIAGYSAAGALVVGSAILFVISGKPDVERRVACLPQGMGLGCRLTF